MVVATAAAGLWIEAGADVVDPCAGPQPTDAEPLDALAALSGASADGLDPAADTSEEYEDLDELAKDRAG